MEAVLKRLLETEHKAEGLVDAAQKERDRMIANAQAEAHAAEVQLEARLPEMRKAYSSKAAERAEQSIAELTRRASERQHDLRYLAESHEKEALAAALALLADSAKE